MRERGSVRTWSRRAVAVLGLLGLAGCSVMGPELPPSAVYDLGPFEVPSGLETPLLRGVGVRAPAWLDGVAMQYRLLYRDSGELRRYSESRWAASPAKLMQASLERALGGTEGCVLQIDLDEFTQYFDAADSSRMVIELRASLEAPRSRNILATRVFAYSLPAPATAAGGVAAARGAVPRIAADLAGWVGGLEHSERRSHIAEQCRQ